MKRQFVVSIEEVKHPASKVPVYRYGFECGHSFVGDLRVWAFLHTDKPLLLQPARGECGDCK